MSKYVCGICGYVYNEAAGLPDEGMAPGTRWEDVPADWCCPACGASKADFTAEQAAAPAAAVAPAAAPVATGAWTAAELGVLCTNLAKGCEKQYRDEEAGLFRTLAAYFDARVPAVSGTLAEVAALLQEELGNLPPAQALATAAGDRGALRALTWNDKVARMLVSHLRRFAAEQEQMLDGTKVYVCEICGFVYTGSEPPEICPVCKVPHLKIAEVVRRN